MSSNGAFAAAACDRGGGGRRGCRDSRTPAAQRPDRARPDRRKTVLHGLSARTSRGFSQPPAGARPRRAGGWNGHARSARLAPSQAPARPGSGRGRSSEPRPPEPGSRCCSWSRGCRSGPGCASARSTWGWPHRPGRTGRSTWSRRAGIGAVTAAIGGLVAVALVRRFPRNWWAPGALLVIAYGVVTIWLYPVVIDPVFNNFEKLKPGQLRSDVLELADRAGVDVGEVYRIDASRRTSAANAYVIGLGHSKRVVLYDNLIHELPARRGARGGGARARPPEAQRPAARARLARAGGARRRRSSRRRSPSALRAAASWARRRGCRRSPWPWRWRDSASGVASNALSRPVEARADSFALELTRDPATS